MGSKRNAACCHGQAMPPYLNSSSSAMSGTDDVRAIARGTCDSSCGVDPEQRLYRGRFDKIWLQQLYAVLPALLAETKLQSAEHRDRSRNLRPASSHAAESTTHTLRCGRTVAFECYNT